MLYNDECYAAFYSVVDLGGFLCWACKEKHWKEAEVILQYLTSRGVGIGCGGELQWGILTKNWTQTTLWLLYLVHRTYTVCRYIKDILRCGRNGNGKKKHSRTWRHGASFWCEKYVHMASVFNNIWQNSFFWGLKFTFVQSFISNTGLVCRQDS